MIGDLFLAFYSSLGGGEVGNILFRWEQIGVFSYILPFLIIFALIYGILNKFNFFGEKSKGINVVISLAVSLMSLQFGFVGIFFSEIFPRMGVFLSVILVLIILAGLFINKNAKGLHNGIMVAVILIVLVIVAQSFSAAGYFLGSFGGGYWWRANFDVIIIVVLVLGGIVAMISPKLPKSKANDSPFVGALTQALGGENK